MKTPKASTICRTVYRDVKGRFTKNAESTPKTKSSRKTRAAKAAPLPPAPAAKPKQVKTLPPESQIPPELRKPAPISAYSRIGSSKKTNPFITAILDPSNEYIGIYLGAMIIWGYGAPLPKIAMEALNRRKSKSDPTNLDYDFAKTKAWPPAPEILRPLLFIGDITKRAKIVENDAEITTARYKGVKLQPVYSKVYGFLEPNSRKILGFDGAMLRALIGHLPKNGHIRFAFHDIPQDKGARIYIFFGRNQPPTLTTQNLIGAYGGIRKDLGLWDPKVKKRGALKLKLKPKNPPKGKLTAKKG